MTDPPQTRRRNESHLPALPLIEAAGGRNGR